MGAIGKIGDAKSVDVVAPSGGVLAGVFYRISGWNGFATKDAAAGETVALQIGTDEAFECNVGAGITANKGSTIYIPAGGAGIADLTNTATSNLPALKVIDAKDSGNVCWAKVLNVA